MPTSRPIRSLLYFLFAVCPLLFFTDLTRNPYYTQIALLNIIVPLCWILWLADALRDGQLVWYSSLFDLPLLALIGFSFVTWILSMRVHPALIKPIYSEGSKAAIFLIVNVFLIYAAALRVRDSALARHLLWITYGVAFIASLYGICQYFGVELIWPSNLNPYGSRPVSTFGNPNFMSSYLVVVIPVMAMDFMYNVTGFPRALLFLDIETSLGALLATLTRSSWAGLLAAMILIFLATRWIHIPAKGRKLLAIAMLMSVFAWPKGGAGYSATVVERVMEVGKVAHEEYASAYQRFLIWLSAWDMAQDHPFVGKGWGCFELFYPFYQGPLLLEKGLSFRTHANNAHNEFLEYLSQLGIIGLGIAIWVWFFFFRLGVMQMNRLSPGQKALAWGMLGGVAGMLVDNILNVSIFFCIPAFIFWWIAGSAVGLDAGAISVRRVDLKPLWKKALLVIVIVGLGGLMARSFAFEMAEINFFKGFKYSKAGDLLAAREYLEKAYAWHHLEVNNNYELANVYARMGEKEKALGMYQRALDANAGYDEIYFNRATLDMQLGKNEDAIANYRICLAINPLSHDAYNALANLYFKDFGRYGKDVEALFNQAVVVYPDDKDMWNNYGYLYTQMGDWTKAAEGYQKAIQIDPTYDLARKNLAVVLARAKISSGASKH